MFEDLAKKGRLSSKGPDWPSVLFDEAPGEEEGELMELEWEGTDDYLALIEKLKGN
jgi:hypothetical protein